MAVGVDPHGPNDEADFSGLRYGKVCILGDADVDGSHIRVLLLTLFLAGRIIDTARLRATIATVILGSALVRLALFTGSGFFARPRLLTLSALLLPAMCGVSSRFGQPWKCALGGSGSSAKTSIAAPPRWPLFSAAASARSSTMPPRAVLIRMAPGFIAAMRAASNNPRVASTSGTCRLSTSLVVISSEYQATR